MSRTLKSRLHRAVPLAALVAIAAIAVPTASAADCTIAKNANCAGQDMRHLGSAMKGQNMSGANLSGADMRGMDMSGMNLTGANMSGANIDGANMNGANMTGANMSGMTMTKVKMVGAKMMKANLTNTTIIGGNWSKAKLMHAKLSGINVSKTNMSHVDFTGASNKGSRPRSLRAAASDAWSSGFFSGVDFSGAIWNNSTVQNAVFTNRSNFHWAQMKNSNFSGTTFVDANYFETFGMVDSNMSGTTMAGNWWAPIYVSRTNFDRARCGYYNVPTDRRIFGTIHSFNQGSFSGSYGNGARVHPGSFGWSYDSSWDWYYTFNAYGTSDFGRNPGTASSSVGVDGGGCLINGVNAST